MASAPTQYSVRLFITHDGGKPTILHMYVAGKAQDPSRVEQLIWISQSTHLPVKEEALGVGVTTMWKNLNVGPQSPGLFEAE